MSKNNIEYKYINNDILKLSLMKSLYNKCDNSIKNLIDQNVLQINNVYFEPNNNQLKFVLSTKEIKDDKLIKKCIQNISISITKNLLEYEL